MYPFGNWCCLLYDVRVRYLSLSWLRTKRKSILICIWHRRGLIGDQERKSLPTSLLLVAPQSSFYFGYFFCFGWIYEKRNHKFLLEKKEEDGSLNILCQVWAGYAFIISKVWTNSRLEGWKLSRFDKTEFDYNMSDCQTWRDKSRTWQICPDSYVHSTVSQSLRVKKL